MSTSPSYASTARFLAHPAPDSRSSSPVLARASSSPAWHRRSLSHSSRPKSLPRRVLAQSEALGRSVVSFYARFSPLQRILIGVLNVVLLVGVVLFAAYNERIFKAIVPLAKRWRDMTGGWAILWALTFVVGFPPLIGYSSCVTLAGFVFGVWKGWLIAATATILGSTASFLTSRFLFHNFVSRMTANDKRFAALSLTLKHDGLKLLIMIRLCPLPYSVANGAISTIPTVQPLAFMIATAIASPKLLLGVFVGARLGAIAESGDKMDFKTKVVSYVSIAIGVVAGVAVGWLMYTKTQARAKELEAQERESAAAGTEDPESLEAGEYEYSDDPAEREAAQTLARSGDGISLHTAAGEEEEEEGPWADERGYRDEFGDDGDAAEDARSLDEVFKAGDEDEGGFRDDNRDEGTRH